MVRYIINPFTNNPDATDDGSGSTPVDFLTGNSGGAVGADSSNNINVLGDTTTINITGNPGTHTLTANVVAPLPASYGGTGVISPMAHAVAVAEGAGNFHFVGPGVAASFLQGLGVGSDPSFTTGPIFNVTMPAGDYTILSSDYFVGATTSAARAITLPASPTTGMTFVIKDITGTASTNNITVSGNGKNIDGSSTNVIATNYASITVIYNGTQWSIT